MILIQTILAFFVVIGVLIMIHELGHYAVARCCGVKVLRFSIGMGKVVWSRRLGKDQTEWAVSALPFGGYVKMLDAREQDVSNMPAEDRLREFTSQNVWKRVMIVSAGPMANFLLAIVIYAGLNLHGFPEPSARVRAMAENTIAWQAGLRSGDLITALNGERVRGWGDFRWQLIEDIVDKKPARLTVQNGAAPSREVNLPLDSLSLKDLEGNFLDKLGLEVARSKATIGTITPNGPAFRGGLRTGDVVESVDAKPVRDGLDFVERVRAAPGQRLAVTVLRNGTIITLAMTPEVVEEKGERVGKVGAEVALMPEMVEVSYGPVEAVTRATMKTWETSVLSIKMLGRMFTGEVSLRNITGPVTIADYAGQSARMGVLTFLGFIAFVSVSLGIMNLLPIPVLDGGHLLFYAFEIVAGRPASAKAGEIGQRIGIGMLLMFMALAVFNDIMRLMN